MMGFVPLGYLMRRTLLTYYSEPDHLRIFSSSGGTTIVEVSRLLTPESGRCVTATWITLLQDGSSLVTGNQGRSPDAEDLRMVIEDCPESSLEQVHQRHQQRLVALGRPEMLGSCGSLEQLAQVYTANYQALRSALRLRRWSVGTNDPALDRITLIGAFSMVKRSIKACGRRGTMRGEVGPTTEDALAMRVEADYQCVRHVARAPQPAPGVPWPLLILIAITAVVSILGMALLWNTQVAIIIFVVLLLHEAGHALVMRMVGHAAVHIFFVPFLGALTIGRFAPATVRQRLLILLAGPVSGLLIAIVVLQIPAHHGIVPWPIVGYAFLVLNALNLLPIVPLDGGRLFETLTRPESKLRLILLCVSGVGLIALATYLRDPVVGALAVLSILFLPQQSLIYRFRLALSRQNLDRQDWLGVARSALVVMTQPQFRQWRSASRQMMARAAAEQFGAPVATVADWVVGIVGYVVSIGIVLVAAMLWARVRPA